MLLLIYFMLAVGVSFLCSILEAVLLSQNQSYIESLKTTKPKLAKRLENQKKNIELSIGSILTLNTFAHTLGAAGVGAEAVKIFGDEYMFYISAILTILILVFSEIIPKTIGAMYWKELAGISSRLIQLLTFITYPLLYIMNFITSFISKNKPIETITKEELKATINMSEEAGIIKQKDFRIMENILKYSKVKVKEIYTPRKVLFSLNQDDLINSLENKVTVNIQMDKLKEYSRIPIFNENIDDIVGVIFSKEFFHEFIENTLENKNDIIRPVFKINENVPISKLLDLFLSKKEHMFIVVDHYDQTKGIVTLEDVLEELLGTEIVDEFDTIINKRAEAKSK
ncbi:MAG: CNNM domain-containing protein [Poseidonibacter sp.]|uniref:CNNM domain-containing protein n=1 Tax=Poseidonibacter sp. TaxID=2321188 RepID=UPI00359E34DE